MCMNFFFRNIGLVLKSMILMLIFSATLIYGGNMKNEVLSIEVKFLKNDISYQIKNLTEHDMYIYDSFEGKVPEYLGVKIIDDMGEIITSVEPNIDNFFSSKMFESTFLVTPVAEDKMRLIKSGGTIVGIAKFQDLIAGLESVVEKKVTDKEYKCQFRMRVYVDREIKNHYETLSEFSNCILR